MSIINNTLKLLGIKDPNIEITDEITSITKKGITYNLVHGNLSYTPEACVKCGAINENFSIIKNGSKSSDVKLLPFNGTPTFLRLKKQRFLCKECGHTFVATTSIVQKHCFLSNFIKRKVLSDLRLKRSEKDIAFDNYVSFSTVSKAVDSCFTRLIPNYHYLPKHLMFDEFRSTKDAKGAMSFIFADAERHEVIDILETRKKQYLTAYFKRYSKDARERVETISMDMYSPYIEIAKELFPNAKVILDKFHLIQLLSRALNSTRVQAMKPLPRTSMQYKRLKRYWKLILAPCLKLNDSEYRHYYHFESWVTQEKVVSYAIAIDPYLKNSYDAYQTLYMDITNSDINKLSNHLKDFKETNISPQMRTAIKSLEHNLGYIRNTFNTTHSNGPLEGMNNYIKVLKRIAFGYKNFFHFRNRILISRKLINPIEGF